MKSEENEQGLYSLTLDACRLAHAAASAASEAIAHGAPSSFALVRATERKLDVLDREVDQRAAAALLRTDLRGARELISCCKITVDVERIGDLLNSFVNRVESVSGKLDMADREALIKMSCVLEKMLADFLRAFTERDVPTALSVFRVDAEIDRLRNLLVVKHTEHDDGARRESVQVLMMAQALERAGDHTKNLAEEVCHLVTGETVRHLLRQNDKPYEQMFIDWLRQQHASNLTKGVAS